MAKHQDKGWSSADVATFVHTLAKEKTNGNWIDNRPTTVAWTTCELALMCSERKSGGSAKTLRQTQALWHRVRLTT
jgi:hypothetical protein